MKTYYQRLCGDLYSHCWIDCPEELSILEVIRTADLHTKNHQLSTNPNYHKIFLTAHKEQSNLIDETIQEAIALGL